MLGGCASSAISPAWQTNAQAALASFTQYYLSGERKLAAYELGRARDDLSATARPDLLARIELTQCAVRVASLEFDACASYQPLAADAAAPEQAYARFLSGQWAGLDVAQLPAQYRALVTQGGQATGQTTSALSGMADPLSRLIAAGTLLQNGLLTPQDIQLATDTASQQGWRRPLLAWLLIQQQRATQAGDAAAAAKLERRIKVLTAGGGDGK